MLNKILQGLILSAILINIALAYLFRGFELGHDEAVSDTHSVGFTAYNLLINAHTYNFLLLLAFWAATYWKTSLLAYLIRFASLLLILYQYRTIYIQKSLFAGSDDSFTRLLRDTLAADHVGMLIIGVLLFLQFASGARQTSRWLRGQETRHGFE
jgi:hypothetical protein